MKIVGGQKGKRSQNSNRLKRSLFQTTAQKTRSDLINANTTKMAAGISAAEESFNLKQELLSFKTNILQSMQQLKTDILNKLNITLQQLGDQLQNIHMTLQQTNKKAELAFNMMDSLHEENCLLRQEIAELKDKAILTEQTLRRKHLKFRGLPDGTENSKELLTKVNLWLTSVLEIDEHAGPAAVSLQTGAFDKYKKTNSKRICSAIHR